MLHCKWKVHLQETSKVAIFSPSTKNSDRVQEPPVSRDCWDKGLFKVSAPTEKCQGSCLSQLTTSLDRDSYRQLRWLFVTNHCDSSSWHGHFYISGALKQTFWKLTAASATEKNCTDCPSTNASPAIHRNHATTLPQYIAFCESRRSTWTGSPLPILKA